MYNSLSFLLYFLKHFYLFYTCLSKSLLQEMTGIIDEKQKNEKYCSYNLS